MAIIFWYASLCVYAQAPATAVPTPPSDSDAGRIAVFDFQHSHENKLGLQQIANVAPQEKTLAQGLPTTLALSSATLSFKKTPQAQMGREAIVLSRLGTLEISCDAPPYELVRGCENLEYSSSHR